MTGNLTDASAMSETGPSPLMTSLTADAQLLAAWQAVRESDEADGHLSRTAQQFDYGAISRLERMRHELLNGTWRPDPPHAHRIPAGDGWRTLTVSSVPDRIIERALSQVLAPLIDPLLSPFSFAYRKGLGHRDAVNAVRECLLSGWTHIVRTDVEAAFDTVPRRRALNRLAAEVADADVLEIVRLLLRRLPGGLDAKGLPQGSALSPMLLNLYLDEVDRAVLKEGFLPIRYADDIAVPVTGELQGLQLLDTLGDLLADLGLRLNDSKTAIQAVDEGIDFLGQRIRPLGGPESLDQAGHPRRISVYATGPGGVLRLKGDRLRFDRDGQTVVSVALNRVRQIVVTGRVGMTTPLLHRASAAGVDVVLLDDGGGYVGRMTRRRGGDVRVRQAQYRAADDEETRLRLAASFVSLKLANMRVAILRDLRRAGQQIDEHSRAMKSADTLERSALHARQAVSVPTLMGVEGAATRAYFDWMEAQLPQEWGFTGRNRRPPRDPVNAMLSYGYTLLCAEVVSACEVAGLDPDLGFLHSPRWGRPSLALDVMEQWRPVLVDTAVLALVRAGHVTPGDFTYQGEACRMSEKAKRSLLAGYERRILTRGSDPHGGGRRAYRELLAVYARTLADSLVNPTIVYLGYRWR